MSGIRRNSGLLEVMRHLRVGPETLSPRVVYELTGVLDVLIACGTAETTSHVS